jgi:hypothetical protein
MREVRAAWGGERPQRQEELLVDDLAVTVERSCELRRPWRVAATPLVAVESHTCSPGAIERGEVVGRSHLPRRHPRSYIRRQIARPAAYAVTEWRPIMLPSVSVTIDTNP